MSTAFRKLSQVDFRKRVARVDSRFARMGPAAYAKDRTPARPLSMALMGFGWIYLVASISNRRDHITASLSQGNLPDHYHQWIFSGLAVMLAASMVLLLLHVVRYFAKSDGKKKNSGGILLGALLAVALFHTPAGVWQGGLGMLDQHSQRMILAAGTTLKDSPVMAINNLPLSD